MKIQPLGEKILLKPVMIAEKTASGIYRSDAGEQKSQTGEVIAVGTDKDITIKKGQEVLYKKFGGDEMNIDGVEYIIVKNEDVLAVIE